MSTYTPGVYTQAVTAEIVERMSARDVTVEELADLADLGEIALRNRLEGRAPWDVEQLYRIAQALKVSVSEVMVVESAA